MKLFLWVTDDGGSWYSQTETSWLAVGDPLQTSQFLIPLQYAVTALHQCVPSLESGRWQKLHIRFKIPLAEAQGPELQRMTVLGEFANCLFELAEALKLNEIKFRCHDLPEIYELEAILSQDFDSLGIQRVNSLLRVGIKILGYQRGLQIDEISNAT